MSSRREVLRNACAGAALLALPSSRAFAAEGPGGSAALSALFDAFLQEGFDFSPEEVTGLGLDTGARAYQKALLGDRSPRAAVLGNALNDSQLARLKAIDPATLNGADKLNREIIQYGLESQAAAAHRFKSAGGSAGAARARCCRR